MLNKILILFGILLGAVLVVENLVTGMVGYLFLDQSASTGVISLISIIIGFAIGYGTKGILIEKEGDEYEDYDF